MNFNFAYSLNLGCQHVSFCEHFSCIHQSHISSMDHLTATEHSILDFFVTTVKPRISDIDGDLLSASRGQDKSSLDQVDISLPIIPVTSSNYSIDPVLSNSSASLSLQFLDDTSPISDHFQAVI